jgi:hypothetical protein
MDRCVRAAYPELRFLGKLLTSKQLSKSFWNYGYVIARALSLWERVAEGQVRDFRQQDCLASRKGLVRAREHSPPKDIEGVVSGCWRGL